VTEAHLARLFWTAFGGGFLTGTAFLIMAFIAVRMFQWWRQDRRERGHFAQDPASSLKRHENRRRD
jgi:cbb3-type cytochrome oxidase subunit 3